MGEEPRSSLALRFEVDEKEPLRLLINVAMGPHLGIYKVSLDGIPVGSDMDFYAPEIAPREFHLLDFWPEPGTYTLTLECVGKNHLSSGHALLIESVRLRERRPRVKEMGWDKDKDWRAEPIYYAGT
jgi:hypothetical protein